LVETSASQFGFSVGMCVSEQIELVGRVAFMVKLRGYSIVPLAVETAMREHPGVHAAVVAVKSGAGGEQLVGYYVASAASAAAVHAMDTPSLRAFLQDKVAAFEVPSTFIQLPEFPLGLTGKIDMKQLPDPRAVGDCGGGRACSDAAANRLLSVTFFHRRRLVLVAVFAVFGLSKSCKRKN
jgi:acyl-CoA synthetase (AMP-forming)/AMP-acid ligase II